MTTDQIISALYKQLGMHQFMASCERGGDAERAYIDGLRESTKYILAHIEPKAAEPGTRGVISADDADDDTTDIIRGLANGLIHSDARCRCTASLTQAVGDYTNTYTVALDGWISRTARDGGETPADGPGDGENG